MWCHVEETWCHEYSVCDVIKHDHWCHNVWMWCDVDWVWCHICAKCDDLHTCCDVIDTEIHRYRCVSFVWWHRYSGHEVKNNGLDVIHLVVWCPKEWMWCQIEEMWCHECSVCDVIKHGHWCHKVWMWCDVDWVWCHMCAKCVDLHTYCDVIDTAIHQYRCVCHLCDDTDTVAVMSNMVGEISGIVIMLSWKQYRDRVHIGYDVINILGVILYIEGYNVINSGGDSMHTEYDVTCIVCVMS